MVSFLNSYMIEEKNEKMKVSIIMAEYNTDLKQLDESIKSIINQTFKDFELIIIDDCGKNDLSTFLDKYKDDRIVLLKNEKNMGLAESLNKGIKCSKSEYIIRMDTDDIALPDRIEKQINFIEEHPEYSIVGGKYILFDENGEKGVRGASGEVVKEDFLKNTPFAHPTLLIRKKDIISSGLYPNYYRCQDYAMEMNMYANGYKGFIMDDVLLKYRQDTNGYKKKKFKYRILEYKIRKKYFKLLNFSFIKRIVYQYKPLLIGLIPNTFLKFYHEKIK